MRCSKCGNVVPANGYCVYCGTEAKFPTNPTPIVGSETKYPSNPITTIATETKYPPNPMPKIALAIFSLGIIATIVFVSARPKSSPQSVTPPASNQSYVQSPIEQENVLLTDTLLPTNTVVPPINSNINPAIDPTLPVRKSCAGAPPLRVEKGDITQVTSNCGDHILMRLYPVVATNAEQYLYSGDELRIIDGPQCSNDVSFFLVEAPKYGKTGWVAEALPEINSKIYCMEPGQ